MTRAGWWLWLQRLLGAALLLAGLLPAARAHEISMAELELREGPAREFSWQWTSGMRSGSGALVPRWPEGCRDDGVTLRCGSAGLAGTLRIDGVGRGFSAVLVRVRWIDGQSSVYTLSAGQREVRLFGGADDRRGRGEIAAAYTGLGFVHVLQGIDHLLFVAALVLLVGFNRRLVLTITAFTVAHSLTLALSALGWLTLRPAPVEATIALSIMLVAAEALSPRPTLTRRFPALVALLFGLVHGLGFAGALKAFGLPEHHTLLALLCFNVGIELGQLLLIALAALAWRWLAPRVAALQRARTPVLYTIGGLAAWWTIARAAALGG
jgi:hypothetical protein